MNYWYYKKYASNNRYTFVTIPDKRVICRDFSFRLLLRDNHEMHLYDNLQSEEKIDYIDCVLNNIINSIMKYLLNLNQLIQIRKFRKLLIKNM